MKLGNKSLLLSSVLVVSVLAGCNNGNIKTNENDTNVKKENITENKKVSINKSINNENNEKQSNNNINSSKTTYEIIKPKTCGKLCKMINIKKIADTMKIKNIKNETIKEPLKNIQNAYPILFTNNLDGVAKVVSALVQKPVKVKQLTDKALKSLGIEKNKEGYYIHLGVEAIGKENYCNDGIDNDGDGKIDLADTDDCKKVVVYYDSKSDKIYNKDSIKEYMDTAMPVGFNLSFIDFEKNKNIYYDLIKKTKKNIYLPVFLIEDIPDYYPVYTESLKKQLGQINYLLNTKDKSELFKYVRLLGQGWDPIKKKVYIKTFNKTGKFTKKELEYYNKNAVLVNPNSNVGIIVWSAGLCPYCKKFITELYHSGNINDFASIDLEEFPLESLHGKTDNDIAVFDKCVANNINNDKLRKDLIKKEYENPQTKVDKYFGLLTDKVQRDIVKKCYDTKYNDILKKIKEKNKSDTERFKIQGTPFIIIYNKKTGNYGTIPGYIPANMIKQAISNLQEKTK